MEGQDSEDVDTEGEDDPGYSDHHHQLQSSSQPLVTVATATSAHDSKEHL